MLINTEVRSPLSQRAALALPLISCATVFLLALLAIKAIRVLGPWSLDGSKPADWSAIGIAFIASISITAVLLLFKRMDVLSLPGVLQFFFVILFLGAVANIIWQFADLIAYGDAGRFSTFIERNRVFPRWFLGSAIMTRLYHYLWSTLGPHLPETLSTADGFVRMTGAALMAASSVVLIRINGCRLAVLVPLLSPIWLMFCTGYSEYYPFIAFVYLGFLSMIQSVDLARRSPVLVALISSFVCLSYTGFVPLGFLLIAFYGVSAGIKKALTALLITGLLCFALIVLLWPQTLREFAFEFHKHLNLGDRNTHYPAYIGKSAGDTTPFFAVSYALSAGHLSHLFFMFFFGAGLVPPFLLLLALRGCLRKGLLTALAKSKVALFLGCCLAFQLCYFVLMIPKFGPVKDIDLFFSVYLTVGFVAGFLGDRLLDTIPTGTRDIWRTCVIGSCIGSSAVILLFMLRLGILPS